MSKLIRSGIILLIFGLIAPAFSVQEASALSIDDWNNFKDHPCQSAAAGYVGSGYAVTCYGNFQQSASLMVPLVYNNSQIPETTFVYSITGMELNWAPIPSNYYQTGHLNRFDVSPTEYYADIYVHPYLYQMLQTKHPTSSYPDFANIGSNITVSLEESIHLKDYYSSSGNGSPLGIGIGIPDTIRNIMQWSVPQKTDPITGPLEETINNLIFTSHPFPLNNKSGSPTSAYPYYNFDSITGLWFFSTMSSAYGTGEWDGRRAFHMNIEYMVELRAWVEPRQHFKYETRMVSPEERGLVCVSSRVYIPSPIGCRPSGGGYGYWSWQVIKSAVFKTGWWAYDITSSDWGGVDDGAYRVPTSDSSSPSCSGCRQTITYWMAPDLSRVLSYNPIVVYESRPLPDKPW